MKPLLRYVGGKTQLLNVFKGVFPASCDTWFEPFVGSMAVTLFAIKELKPKRIVVADANALLIQFYLVLQSTVENFISELTIPGKYVNEEKTYYEMRERFNAVDDAESIEKAVLFYYLNKTCFNGLYRVNRSGKFNVPYGKRKTVSMSPAVLREFSDYIKHVEFTCCPFQQFFQVHAPEFTQDDFIYCDPPYDGTFTNYQSTGFTNDVQKELESICAGYKTKIMLSNSNTDFIKDLYREWSIQVVFASRMVNSDATKRGKQDIEVVITNF